MDTRLALMCGIDIPIPECQLIIHQPKIKEIAFIGEKDFFTGIQTLCINKRMFTQDKTLLENTNNFQIFMTIMSEKETVDKKESVQQVCALLFPEQKVMFTPRSMLLSGAGGMTTIDETNFELDDEIKNQFDMICKQEGLLSDMAVTCFVKTVVSECKIPFMIGVDPNYRRNKLKECVEKLRSFR